MLMDRSTRDMIKEEAVEPRKVLSSTNLCRTRSSSQCAPSGSELFGTVFRKEMGEATDALGDG